MKEGQITLRDRIHIVTRRWASDSPRARVVIVHGLCDHSGRWAHVAEFFAERGFETHAYDLRGHGLSGGARLDIEHFHQHVDDLAEVVAHVHDGELPLVIYGHSMGGLIAAAYAQSSHPQPDVYVLSAPSLEATVPAPLRAAVNLLARFAPDMRVRASIKGEHLSKNPEVGEAYFADPRVYLKGTARGGHSFLSAMEGIRRKLDEIDRPTLVVHGGEDILVPTAVSAPLAAAPNVTRKVFPTLRHEIHNEDERTEVLEYVYDWLDQQIEETVAR